jgi:hypothetical protein
MWFRLVVWVFTTTGGFCHCQSALDGNEERIKPAVIGIQVCRCKKDQNFDL